MASADVFLSYSHKDREWLDRLRTMLSPYVNQEGLCVWSDNEIAPGSQWRGEIESASESARVAVLLVSPDFLASEFIRYHEIPALVTAQRSGRLALLWIAVRPSMYEETELSEYQALNDPSSPLSTIELPSVEMELVKICYKIKSELLKSRTPSSASNPPDELESRLENRRMAMARCSVFMAQHEADLKALTTAVHELDHPAEAELAELLEGAMAEHSMKMAKLTEELVRVDVATLEAAEAALKAGLDPTTYDLPTFDEALRRFAKRSEAQKEFLRDAKTHSKARKKFLNHLRLREALPRVT